MEKWARNFQLIINKRDALLNQLNQITGKYYTYQNLKHISTKDFKTTEAKILFAQLQKSIKDYNEALENRDQLMFGKFLDSLIHEEKPTKESQNWCANQY
ncbi:hypothetical protein [Plebeiibacterium sediminum]|uniref:Uncharacterized protein n=1 Tax=Plebeiibacterium sediminum TaxID=2992112 RepID=A0AAE3M8C3_9BACT|nr:hypothetical protein [Plebeiobacterium sediminum]MCW3789116.1 hypothetical protein [Plebeiobacterium sediminum]